MSWAKSGLVLFMAVLMILQGGCPVAGNAAEPDPVREIQDQETRSGAKGIQEAEDGAGAEQTWLENHVWENDTAAAYVLVSDPEPVRLLPLPAEGEYTETLSRTLEDGTEWINTVHLTPEGFWMEEANCKGQDCIGEGTVTLTNREERILGNAVVCLPHELLLELLTREEAMRRFP